MTWLNTYSYLLTVLILVLCGCRENSVFATEQLSVDGPSSLATDSDTGSDRGESTDLGTDSAAQPQGCALPTSFAWSGSGILAYPPIGRHTIKDPTVVRYGEQWLIYATTSLPPEINMHYFSLTDWNLIDSTEHVSASLNPNLTGYKAAPQLFKFSRDGRWYLVYQTSAPAYSTTQTPGDGSSWSAMTLFMDVPSLIRDEGETGFDYWIICDETNCYMFFMALNGALYRAVTTKTNFPDGFAGTTVEVMRAENKYALFSACNVYKIAGSALYLLLVSAIDSSGSRYFRSWTASRLDGDWTPLADTPENAFASAGNVSGSTWSEGGISHGEMLRTVDDESMTIDPCDMKFLFSGNYRDEVDTDVEHYALGLLSHRP